MPVPLLPKWNDCARRLAAMAGNWWCTPPLQLRPTETSLELPLQPSSRLRRARWLISFASLLYGIELWLTGHRLVPWLAFAAMANFCPLPRALCAARKTPERLVLSADGRLQLHYAGGELQQARLQPQSLRLGSHLLLVLRTETGVFRLLLGPDNAAPADLAALRRRLPAGPVAAATALHSTAASGSKSDPT